MSDVLRTDGAVQGKSEGPPVRQQQREQFHVQKAAIENRRHEHEYRPAAPRPGRQAGENLPAILDAEATAKWLPPSGFTCKVHHMDAKVGGTFRMSFKNFTTGNGHSFGGKYLELVPDELIRYTDQFDDPNLPGVIQVKIILKAVSVGTEINIEQAGLPSVIPIEACYLGWQQSLAQLAQLVEPEITD